MAPYPAPFRGSVKKLERTTCGRGQGIRKRHFCFENASTYGVTLGVRVGNQEVESEDNLGEL